MSLNTVTVTGWSGFWNTQGDRAPYGFLPGQNRANPANVIAKYMKRNSVRDARALLSALIGASAGGSVVASHKQVAAPSSTSQTVPAVTNLTDLGGLRVVETVTDINRVSTSADVTELKKWVANDALLEAGITYPAVAGPNIAAGTQINNVSRF